MKKQMKKNNFIVMCGLLFLAAAFNCYAASADQSVISGQAQIASALEALKNPSRIYSYNPAGKPDPFKPFIDLQVMSSTKVQAQAQGPVKVESIFPLQRENAQSYNLVGVIGDETRRVAMVEDSAKKFYPIFVGTHIGLNNGKVTEILADRLMVQELDGKKIKIIVLKLRKD